MIEIAAVILLTVSFATVVSFGAYFAYRLVVLSHAWINKERSAWVSDRSKKNRRSTDEPMRIIPEGFWYEVSILLQDRHTVRALDVGGES